MHQLKSLRDEFILPMKEIETSHYPGYVIRLQNKRQIQTKKSIFAQKGCPSQINIKLLTTNMKFFQWRLYFQWQQSLLLW